MENKLNLPPNMCIYASRGILAAPWAGKAFLMVVERVVDRGPIRLQSRPEQIESICYVEAIVTGVEMSVVRTWTDS